MDHHDASPNRSSTVLLVGTEQMLLYTRKAILEKEHFAVSVARPDQAPDLLQHSDYDVIITCHTLAPEEIDRVTEAAKSRAPVPRLIRFTKQPFSPSKLGAFDAAVWSLAAPETLLKSVFALLPSRQN